MSDYDNNNSGVLFTNDKKTKPNQPALRGFMTIDDVEYWASAWRKISSETGKPYISIALQEKDVEEPETINAELHKDEDRKSDKAPGFRGTITMSEEQELNIVGWVRLNSKTNTNMISIKVDDSEGEGQGSGDKIDSGDVFFGMGADTPAQEEQAPEMDDDFDDSIPF